MIRQLGGMPGGAIAFEASGEVTADDYRTVMVPVASAALECGGSAAALRRRRAQEVLPRRPVRRRQAPSGAPPGLEQGGRGHDADWLENAIKAFGWMIPGEIAVFDDELEEAKEWLAKPGD